MRQKLDKKLILVPLDGGTKAEQVLQLIPGLVRGRKDEYRFLLVLNQFQFRPMPPGAMPATWSLADPEVKGEEKEYLKNICDRLQKSGYEASAMVMTGHPGESLPRVAEHNGAELIMMATEGREGLLRWFAGSVTEQVLRHTEVPLLVLRPTRKQKEGVPAPWLRPPQSLLFPVSGDGTATAVLSKVVDLAGRFEAAVTVLHVEDKQAGGEDAEFRFVCNALSLAGLLHDPILRRGSPAKAILKAARQLKSGAIVMGTHARSGLGRLFFGSVTEEVLRRTPVPVFAFPRPETSDKKAQAS